MPAASPKDCRLRSQKPSKAYQPRKRQASAAEPKRRMTAVRSSLGIFALERARAFLAQEGQAGRRSPGPQFLRAATRKPLVLR